MFRYNILLKTIKMNIKSEISHTSGRWRDGDGFSFYQEFSTERFSKFPNLMIFQDLKCFIDWVIRYIM